MGRTGRKAAFFRIRSFFHAQLLFLLWFVAMTGYYCHLGMGFAFTGTLLVIGIALACIAYSLSYMSCSQKNLRWWEFGNDTEEYWVLGKDD